MYIVIRSRYKRVFRYFYTFDFFNLTISISDGRIYDLEFTGDYRMSDNTYIAVNQIDKSDTFSVTVDRTPNEIIKSLDDFQKGKIKIHSTYSVRLRDKLVGSIIGGRKQLWFTHFHGYVKCGDQDIKTIRDNWERYTGRSWGTFSKGTVESRKLVQSTAPPRLLILSGIPDFYFQCEDCKEEEIQAITLVATYLRDLYYSY